MVPEGDGRGITGIRHFEGQGGRGPYVRGVGGMLVKWLQRGAVPCILSKEVLSKNAARDPSLSVSFSRNIN